MPALENLGYEVVISAVDLLPASHFMGVKKPFTSEELAMRSKLTEQIINEVKTVHQQQGIDLFLSYFYDSHFDPSGFDEIKKLGIPIVNFYCNSIYQFELVEEISAAVDFAWHAEKHARDSYLSVGANPIWVQMGGNPDLYAPVAVSKRTKKACFVGQRYADRAMYLAALVDNQVPVDIYGNSWGWTPPENEAAIAPPKPKEPSIEPQDAIPTGSYLGREIPQLGGLKSYLNVISETLNERGLIKGWANVFEQFLYRQQNQQLIAKLTSSAKGFAESIPETFSSYEVVLNFSNVWGNGRPGSGLIPHVRLRDFEAPLCRSCYLTGYTDEITEFYEIGKEIDTYSSPEELVEKTKFYLEHPDAAEKLRNAGYERALRDHTWENRFRELFSKIGLS
ncbi:glycosyltransferase [[Limnothrix rosea] IAM M-220]|uniref:glycosyltransferase family protein n=1 Tax=[Limnothrix rosea] IAM M-220 TaxID=454133 RepID=UPI000969AB0F|nr:glycosyltransferase [[Limnothrix rosea] IAM M-220]OKH19903.1 hypothetical protein NIES208_00010 [[Limnothrix rosea] IAM M-220]